MPLLICSHTDTLASIHICIIAPKYVSLGTEELIESHTSLPDLNIPLIIHFL